MSTDLIDRLRSVDRVFATEAADRIEQLEKRLEISPRTKYDGIDCRDATIKALERENAELESKLAKAEHDLFHAGLKSQDNPDDYVMQY
jgi:hypothetical protein